MPIYDYHCDKCGKTDEYLIQNQVIPVCCGAPMRRLYTLGQQIIKMKYPLWVDRIEDIHKAQEQRGERLRFVHPSEVL